jgi:hypothetical protein
VSNRTRPPILAATLVAGLLLVPSLAAAPTRSLPFGAKLSAPTHRPKANTKWYYTIQVADRHGKPIKARITVQIEDPLGTLHPVLYANTKKSLVNWPINGRFRDYVIWPRSSAIGITLTLRVTVKAAGAKTVLGYPVSPTA